MQIGIPCVGAGMLFSAVLAGSPASAALISYTDRATFTSAAGVLKTETFNSVVGQPSFRTAPVTVGDLTLLGTGNQVDRNYIEQTPQFPEFNVDGTANINAFVSGVGSTAGAGFTITFDAPLLSFGADFAGLQDRFDRTRITAAGETLAPPVQPANDILFYGFVSTNPFTTVTFSGIMPVGFGGSDGFGIDNVSYGFVGAGPVSVPEPASWTFMLVGFGAIAAAFRAFQPKLTCGLTLT